MCTDDSFPESAGVRPLLVDRRFEQHDHSGGIEPARRVHDERLPPDEKPTTSVCAAEAGDERHEVVDLLLSSTVGLSRRARRGPDRAGCT